MDLSTLLGLIAGFYILLKAVGNDPSVVYDGLSLLIVLGGGIAATWVAYPLTHSVRILAVFWRVFWFTSLPLSELIKKLVDFAETAQREGILALESRVHEIDNAFATTAVRLAVDGTEPELIRTLLETDLSSLEQRHRLDWKLMRDLGIHWAFFGAVGALVILILRPGGAESGFDLLSQAALPLLYGLLLAGLIATPFKRKLEVRSKEEILEKRIILEGVLSIQLGDNPRIVEQKLGMFVPPFLRLQSSEDEEYFEEVTDEEYEVVAEEVEEGTLEDLLEDLDPASTASAAPREPEEEDRFEEGALKDLLEDLDPASTASEVRRKIETALQLRTEQPDSVLKLATDVIRQHLNQEEASTTFEGTAQLIEQAVAQKTLSSGAVALTLHHLHPTQAAPLLAAFSRNFRAQIVRTVDQGDRILDGEDNPESAFLQAVLLQAPEAGSKKLGDLLSYLESQTRETIFNELREDVPGVAKRIRAQMFLFDDIARLGDRQIQLILREVDTKDLAVALKGAGQEAQDRFFANMSSRVGTMLKEEMVYSEQVWMGEVHEVQQRIIQTVRQLEESGQISVPKHL